MTGSLGQDWAGYQPASPPTAGLSFVFVKATEGTTYVNPEHASQVATARAAGLVVGHYHFARPGSMSAQVAYFLQRAAPQPGDLLAFDWEDPGVFNADKDAWIRAAQVAAPKHQVLLYCNRDYWTNRDTTSFAGDGLWIADPSATKGQPRITAPWVMHQYSSAGGYDRNYTPMSPEQLRAWATAKEDDMPLTAADAKLLLDTRMDDPTKPGTETVTVRGALWAAYGQANKTAGNTGTLLTQVTALSATVKTLAGLLGSGVDTAAVVDAVEQAIATAVVHIQVDVTGTQPTTP
jgi:hypothetical protein